MPTLTGNADEELTTEVMQRLVDSYPATKGWTITGFEQMTDTVTVEEKTPGGLVTGSHTEKRPNGKVKIVVAPPAGSAQGVGGRTIEVSRGGPPRNPSATSGPDSQGTGAWVTSGQPSDIPRDSTTTNNAPITAEQRDAEAREARAKADQAIAQGASDAAALKEDDRQRSYHLEHDGIYLNHVDFSKWQNANSAEARALIAAKATADQNAWTRTHQAEADRSAKRQADITNHPPQTQTRDGKSVTLLWDTDTQQYVVPAGLTGTDVKSEWMIGDKDSPTWTFVDGQGNIIRTQKNPGFVEGKPTQGTPNTVAPFIPTSVQDPATGRWTIQNVPNVNQLTISQAMMEQLYPGIAKAMTDGKIDAQTGIQLMTQAAELMKNQISAATGATTAANDTLTQLNAGARTGADLLNTRVHETQNSLNTWIGAAGQNKNLGLGTQLGANFGSNLVNGLGEWATQMGGGQGVYDNAVKAVAAINPDDPHSAPSYATLSNMQKRFSELSGFEHPSVQLSTQTPLNPAPPPAGPVGPDGYDHGENYGSGAASHPQAPMAPAAPLAPGMEHYAAGGLGPIMDPGAMFANQITDRMVEEYADRNKAQPGMNWEVARQKLMSGLR